jgi:hypothetical protein
VYVVEFTGSTIYHVTIKLLQEKCGMLHKKILLLLVSTHTHKNTRPPVLITCSLFVIRMKNLEYAMEVAIHFQVPVM